jgi:hypothetical protein
MQVYEGKEKQFAELLAKGMAQQSTVPNPETGVCVCVQHQFSLQVLLL